ncbi:MAG: MotA/TolQ/ExbB proton channel family protein [bacterium]
MNILAGLETFLYVISSALFYPVIAGLVLLTFWIVIFLGGFLREYIERRQGHYLAVERYKTVISSPAVDTNLDLHLERLLQKAELDLIKSLDQIRFVIRVGPALGLMGTLIPMGIALSALAQGDMPKMAGSMVTAFTTVVVGLACSVIAYILSLIKEKWVRADMREMEYLTELMLRNAKLEGANEIFEETQTI